MPPTTTLNVSKSHSEMSTGMTFAACKSLRMFAEPEREFQVIVRDCTPLDDLRGLEAAECHDIKDYRSAEQLQVLTVHSFNYART